MIIKIYLILFENKVIFIPSEQKYLTARVLAEMCELGKLNNPVKDEVTQYTLQCCEYWRSNPEQVRRK